MLVKEDGDGRDEGGVEALCGTRGGGCVEAGECLEVVKTTEEASQGARLLPSDPAAASSEKEPLGVDVEEEDEEDDEEEGDGGREH